MDIKLQIVFFVSTAISILIGAIWVFTTEKRLKRFFLGKKAKDLEDTIVSLEQDIVDLKSAKASIQKEVAVINTKLKK